MITIKSKQEIEKMRRAGKIVSDTFALLRQNTKPGITTKELDKMAYEYIKSQDAIPSFLGYNGFPASICASKNNEVVHGFPDDIQLIDGDIISIDIGACYMGYHADSAKTFAVGAISDEVKRLIETTRKCFYRGASQARKGNRIGDISSAIQSCAEGAGYSVVRDLVGHGVGANLHEEPNVPNFGSPGRGMRLAPGMTIAVEPMINQGTWKVYISDNDWTVCTQDGKLSAHYEHTILITDGECEILTK